MSGTKDFVSLVYNHLQSHKCLCKFILGRSATDLWTEMSQQCFVKKDEESNDNQLLCISFLRLTGEVYINTTLKYQCVCTHVHEFFQIFSSEEIWVMFVNHLKSCENRYLIYTFIKAISTILSSSHESTFSLRIISLLHDIKDHLFSKSNNNVLDFLSNLAQHNFKTCAIDFNVGMCNNIHPKSVNLLGGLFQCLCTLLSQYWSSFLKQYHELISSKCENENLINFLTLWLRIVQKLTEKDLFHVYLNEDCIIKFLLYAFNLDVISLRIYVDIIMQFFISSVKYTSSEEKFSNSFEETVVATIENKFFDLLPSDIQISGLCVFIESQSIKSFDAKDSYHENFQKCDSVIVKKITFIFLNLITVFKTKEFLCDITLEVLNFVKKNFHLPVTEPIYVWINNVFVDQDDILLGVMLALLKIYISLGKKSSVEYSSMHIELQNYLNPHEIFIHFLQRLGFDHNELISFLISDETCFLLYIMTYLKLLIQEWDIFMKAHDNLIKTEEDVFESSSVNTNQEDELLESPPCDSLQTKLVSYSSSSSEEGASFVDQDKHESAQVLIVVTTLGKLKETLKKLVAAGEFPYNVSPLIVLLQTCENQLTLK